MSFRVLPLAFSVLAASVAPGCIIVSGDGEDDGMAEDGTDGDGTDGDETDGNDGNDSNASADETGSGGGADAPESGTWLYTETGDTTNDCTFLEDPSNGWGEYQVTANDDGFLVTPGDGTEPFQCSSGGGTFDCPERLTDESTEGTSTLSVFVSITGTLPREDEMAGSQDGRIECSGPDCALAEQLLGTSFPCSFSIGFTGSHT